ANVTATANVISRACSARRPPRLPHPTPSTAERCNGAVGWAKRRAFASRAHQNVCFISEQAADRGSCTTDQAARGRQRKDGGHARPSARLAHPTASLS